MRVKNLFLTKFYTGIFCVLTCYILYFFGIQTFNDTSLNIDTGLKDLAPDIAQNPSLQSGINVLTKQLEEKFIVLLSSPDIDELEQAIDQFTLGLNSISNLKQVGDNDETLNNIVSTLTPYRFNFLTPKQQTLLNEVNINVDNKNNIINQAHARLTQLSSLRLTPLKTDPLGWFSQYLLFSIESLSGNANEDGIIFDDINEHYHRPFYISIKQGALELDTQHHLKDSLFKLEKQLVNQNPTLTINRSGIFFFAADAAVAAEKDIKRVSMWSSIGIILVLSLAFMSIFALALPSFSIAIGIISAFVITHSIYGSLHVLTIVFGASLIGIVVDYSLHYFYYKSHETELNNLKSLQAKLPSKLHKALALSLCTSVIGYSALGFSELVSLQKIAVFSVAGLISSWLTVIVLANFLSPKNLTTSKKLIPSLLSALQFMINHSIGRISHVLIILIIVLTSYLGFNNKINVDDSPRIFFKPSAELLKQEQFVSNLSNDYEPGRYFIFQGNSTQAVYDVIDDLFKSSKKLNPEDILTVKQWLPSPKQQAKNYLKQAPLFLNENGSNNVIQNSSISSHFLNQLGSSPTLANELSIEYQKGFSAIEPTELFSALGSSAPPLWLDRRNETTNAGIISFGLIKKGRPTDGLEAISKQIEGLEYIDTLALSTLALKKQRLSASKVLVLSYLLIALILLLRYKSIRSIKLLLVPIMASISTILILSVFGQAITLFHVMALFLVLGLGMDYVIFCAELHDQQQTALQAILLSAITSVMSFGLLSLSNMPVVSAFGLTILIGNSINLIACVMMAKPKPELH